MIVTWVIMKAIDPPPGSPEPDRFPQKLIDGLVIGYPATGTKELPLQFVCTQAENIGVLAPDAWKECKRFEMDEDDEEVLVGVFGTFLEQFFELN